MLFSHWFCSNPTKYSFRNRTAVRSATIQAESKAIIASVEQERNNKEQHRQPTTELQLAKLKQEKMSLLASAAATLDSVVATDNDKTHGKSD